MWAIVIRLPIPRPTLMHETQQGRLQYDVLRYDEGSDLVGKVKMAEHAFDKVWSDLNNLEYCSLYVTTY